MNNALTMITTTKMFCQNLLFLSKDEEFSNNISYHLHVFKWMLSHSECYNHNLHLQETAKIVPKSFNTSIVNVIVFSSKANTH